MPNRSALGTLFRYELKMLLRDRRTLFFAVILPIVLVPAMILLLRFTAEQGEERRQSRSYEYAVAGRRAGLARSLIADALAIDTAAHGLVEERPVDPASALAAGELDVVVEALSAGEAWLIRDSARAARAREAVRQAERRGLDSVDIARAIEAATAQLETTTAPPVPLIRLRFRGDDEESEAGAARLLERLERLREQRRHAAYLEAGLPVDPSAVAAVELRGLASPERESGARLALWLTPLLVLLMLTGGSVVAADAISGEKERGTLETLLTTSIRRREIVHAKQLLIIVVGLAITVINLANLGIYLGLGLFELPEGFVLGVSPLALVVLLMLFLPLTVLIASVLLMVSGYSKSYREYQIYMLPLMLLFLLPASAAALPGLELASVISVVPIANISVAVREVLIGEYDWAFLAVAFATTVGLAAWLARLTERTLSTEKLITAAELDEADLHGGPALFRRHVLRWFGVLWVVFFLTSLWSGNQDVRTQILNNVVGIFLGGSILMIWRYRLDVRQTLALRMPRAPVWLAVIVGAPSALVVGMGLAQLGELVFPVPPRMVEAFGQFLLPEGMPLWQIVLFLAVLPGICEEIAFRGVLLHGLHRRFRPLPLALAVGAVFAFFHVDLFRIVPTAYLGTLLAGVTLATGSIFPAMLWHTLNNAVALVPSHLGWWADAEVLPGWLYPAAAAGLALAGLLIWYYRTPYPGLADRERHEDPGG